MFIFFIKRNVLCIIISLANLLVNKDYRLCPFLYCWTTNIFTTYRSARRKKTFIFRRKAIPWLRIFFFLSLLRSLWYFQAHAMNSNIYNSFCKLKNSKLELIFFMEVVPGWFFVSSTEYLTHFLKGNFSSSRLSVENSIGTAGLLRYPPAFWITQ